MDKKGPHKGNWKDAAVEAGEVSGLRAQYSLHGWDLCILKSDCFVTPIVLAL